MWKSAETSKLPYVNNENVLHEWTVELYLCG